MGVASSDPIYPISVAARLLNVHPRTIRIYEEEGLVKPSRQGSKRYFSNDDIEWIQCLRDLIHDDGISIPGLKKLLDLSPCWEIKSCDPDKRSHCSAYVDRTKPCWERANTACAKELKQCAACEVFMQRMRGAREKVVEMREVRRGK
ncbi:MAG: MerR family transcriptional regulator [Desulfuromonadales bacterium]|nr:MerR family transcriptional regulator [Desulfuromonadales bacterium]MDW7757939.1 MerR family transcriptional regulator [Desulfuromonadales bacterium]